MERAKGFEPSTFGLGSQRSFGVKALRGKGLIFGLTPTQHRDFGRKGQKKYRSSRRS